MWSKGYDLRAFDADDEVMLFHPSPLPVRATGSVSVRHGEVEGGDCAEVGQRDHAARSRRGLGASAAFNTASRAERVLIDAPIGSGFFSVSFHRENVVG